MTKSSKPLNILLSGAGPACCACAYWLNLSGHNTTIIERSPELRKAGQQIDLRGLALQLVKKMGLYEEIRSRTVKEEGLAFVNSKGNAVGSFPMDENGASFTSEIEILREDLVKVFYDATKPNQPGGGTKYIFGDYVTGIENMENSVQVEFDSGKKAEYDLIIGGDGMGSKIRRLIFPNVNGIKHLGQYTAYFTIPYQESDAGFAKWYNAVGGRCILLRPDGKGCTRAFISIMSTKPAGFYKLSQAEQKALLRSLFLDAGWEARRILDAMDQTEDFYMQEIAQVRMDSWSKGRVALLGDAGYCPSPISGMGTSLAVIGAYILAGEISKNPGDLDRAFEGYDEMMRPYVDKAQALFPGAPALLNPQTRWGIAILNSIVWFVSTTRLMTLLGKIFGSGEKEEKVPVYEF